MKDTESLFVRTWGISFDPISVFRFGIGIELDFRSPAIGLRFPGGVLMIGWIPKVSEAGTVANDILLDPITYMSTPKKENPCPPT